MKTARYKKSILQEDKACHYCGCSHDLEHHEFLSGPNRRLAIEDGLWVWCCHYCHMEIQNDAETMLAGRQLSQETYESKIGTKMQFMARYGKNYI